MHVRRALVLGQMLPGVPVWRLGDDSRFPGLVYVVYPGNVGGADALTHIVTAFLPEKGWTLMLVSTAAMLQAAEAGGYAVGGFNVYDLNGVKAVIGAAEAARSPVLVQILPGTLEQRGLPLVAMCLAAAREAAVPVNVHLDHFKVAADITACLEAGVTSIMADGSHHPYQENLAFTRQMAALARQHGAAIEAELGQLSGSEDGFTVAEYQASLTDPAQAVDYVAATGVDSLAVCVGNVHGPYPGEPQIDFDRLATIHDRVDVPLVMHGASGLPAAMITRAIELGIRKFNVNTEVRDAYLAALKQALAPDKINILAVMAHCVAAMQAVVAEKMALFGSVDQHRLLKG